MLITYTLILAASAFLFSFLGTALLVRLLAWLKVMDTPGLRSNHTIPVPRGGGLAVMLVSLGFLTVVGLPNELLVAMVLLMIVSFRDDRRPLPVRVRLAAQVIAVALGLMHIYHPVFPGNVLPFWLDHVLAGLLWLWFINLYNFMDGIDELSATQTVSLVVGLMALVATVARVPDALAVDGAILAASIAGFWWFNRHPARIFLGDVGSIPLGLLMGYMLLKLSASGQWAAALILPAYYISDATVTILRRLLARKKIWEAHSEHAYQRAVRAGWRHDDVARHVLALNLVLITLAVVSTLGGIAAYAAVAAAYLLALLLMRHFTRPVVSGTTVSYAPVS